MNDELVNFHLLCRSLVHLREGIRDHGLYSLRKGIEVDNLFRRLWLEAVQPVKEMNQRLQSVLLAFLHSFVQILLHFLHLPLTVETDVPSLERNGVVEVKLTGVPEHLWYSLRGEVTREGTLDVCEHEGNVAG